MEPVSDFWAATRVISQALDGLDHTALSTMPDTEKVQAMTCLRTLARRLDTSARVVTDAVAKSCATERATGLALSDFLAKEEGRSSSQGIGEVHRASAITANGTVRDAALAGTITPDHAVAIGQQLRQLPLDEMSADEKDAAAGKFIDAARTTAPGQLSRRTASVLEAAAPRLAPSAADRAARAAALRRQAEAERKFCWGSDDHGSIWFSGKVPELEGRTIIGALQAFAEKGRQAERAELDALKVQRNRGIITTARYLTLRKEVDARGARTTAQRMADALVDATNLLASTDLIPSAGGQPPRIVVTIGYEDMRKSLQGLIDAGTFEGEVPVDAGTLRRMCCDAEILPIVLGSDSQIMDVGRSERLVTSAIRRALEHRDGGCIYEGCTVPAALCQAHHVLPWWAGGRTQLSNLVLVCRHHHTIVEPGRYRDRDQPRVVFDPDTGRPRVVEPDRSRAYRASAQHDNRVGNPDPGENSALLTGRARPRTDDPDHQESSAPSTGRARPRTDDPDHQESSAQPTRAGDPDPRENSAHLSPLPSPPRPPDSLDRRSEDADQRQEALV